MKILVSALETSSNLHLSKLLEHAPENIEIVGIFEKNLGKPIVDLSQNAIMGFIDAIKKLPFFFKLKAKMVELSKTCDKVLLMDSSGFNLPLAKAIKKSNPNIEIIYYILPQAWAWKKKRVFALDKYCDKLLSIIPFENTIYPNPKKVQFVGHPLLDQINIFHTNQNTNNLCYMPGSRKSEIKSLMPIFRQTAKKFKSKKNILIIPQKFTDDYIKENYGDLSDFEISRDAHLVLANADFAFICSGTATLEAALIGTPFVLCYIAKKFDWIVGKLIVNLDFIGLANIFFQKMGKPPLHIELLQDNVTSKNLITAYNSCDKETFEANAKLLREYLQGPSSQNVAQIIFR